MRSSPFAAIDARAAPAPDAAAAAFLSAQPFAHRGLHGPHAAENGMRAFAAAMTRGHGIECDVRLARDGTAMVFHDDALERMTGAEGRIATRSAGTLADLRLPDGGAIPTLEALLATVSGAVPLLIELKTGGGDGPALCAAVRRALAGYRGPVGIMSFDPAVGHWFARHAPRLLRGLVVSEAGRHGLRARLGRHRALWRSRAQFLAYDVRDLPSRFAADQAARGLPLIGWTVRDDATLAAIRALGGQPTYEETGTWTLPA